MLLNSKCLDKLAGPTVYFRLVVASLPGLLSRFLLKLQFWRQERKNELSEG